VARGPAAVRRIARRRPLTDTWGNSGGGRRKVGSHIPRRTADGCANPVLTAVLAGRTHTGEATVADQPYSTAHEGLHSADGELVGMLYVGMPLDALPG